MGALKTYDPKCLELAKAFLSDEPDLNTDANAHALALEIQQCVEDEIYFMGLTGRIEKMRAEA